jgi:hypothetical protein
MTIDGLRLRGLGRIGSHAEGGVNVNYMPEGWVASEHSGKAADEFGTWDGTDNWTYGVPSATNISDGIPDHGHSFSLVNIEDTNTMTMKDTWVTGNYGGQANPANTGTGYPNGKDYGAGIAVNGSGTLTLGMGCVVAYNATAVGDGGGIGGSGKVTLKDGATVEHNQARTNGGGLAFWSNNSNTSPPDPKVVNLTMEAGAVISNNRCLESGGGVSIRKAIFNMKDGTIKDNLASLNKLTTASGGNGNGGGVTVLLHATFNMEAGSIINNQSIANPENDMYGGGGVSLWMNYVIFNMKGGTISGNVEWGAGGGGVFMYTPYGEFNMTGNSLITGNTHHGKGAAAADPTTAPGGGLHMRKGSNGTVTINTTDNPSIRGNFRRDCPGYDDPPDRLQQDREYERDWNATGTW